MPQTLRLGLASLNQTPLDWPGNLERIRAVVRQAQCQQVHLLCLPELAITGYGCEDAFLHPDTTTRAAQHVTQLAAEIDQLVLLVGFPLSLDGHCYNGLAVCAEGAVRAIFCKSYLARQGIHYEPRWFDAWPSGTLDRRPFGDNPTPIPIGNFTLAYDDFIFSSEICEDAWVTRDKRNCRLARYAHFIFNASASHFSMGKADVRENLVRDSSRDFNIGYGYANLLGCESGRAIYDGECLFAHEGRIVQRGPRLECSDGNVTVYDFPYEGRAEAVTTCELRLPRNAAIPEATPVSYQTERDVADEDEAFAKAASTALIDYMRKSRARGFTLSLSGGVDSSTVAVLVAVAASRMRKALDPATRRRWFTYFPELLEAFENPDRLMPQLLTTVYQGTRNSGPVTRNAAEKLAQSLGATHLNLDVDPMVSAYTSAISQALGRPLTWEQDDIALQNIQARSRGPSVWMLANIRGSLLLSTSNRSEVAVGYATMDGDTCGGLSPIAGVAKSFLQHWLVRVEQEGVAGLAAVPALRTVNEQEPTAELRPPNAAQEDEKDLMPYAVLDSLEEFLIGQRLPLREAFQKLCTRFETQRSRTQLLEWTAKFCRMFATSQWKRERYAPAFHLDDSNLDPKTWARYPILSGCFAAEIQELREEEASNGETP
ncbi:NAD(+) synthase [Acanthopleuribacter pedis]|uniref:Glutamine-dependent NAD(+) synthetase n=1 Tax=Acanthopleuribacter pedis TaxID=442870 RepID=A0A8J7U291_9BACT|nr:NAD(+) synthase [Acanthopleuribacter pedis]MBO1317023.1 NAD(+) synthase [Acanthopleuribacter pedis]